MILYYVSISFMIHSNQKYLDSEDIYGVKKK